jgi:hypothetical protein
VTKPRAAYQHVLNVLVRTGAREPEDLELAAQVPA